MVKTVTAFVIKRSEWLRGEGTIPSRLLRIKDNKRCCVGIYARALGVPDAQLRDVGWPVHLSRYSPTQMCWTLAPEDEAYWLVAPERGIQERTLSMTNDKAAEESGRECRIAAIFAKHDITVTFED